MKLKFTIISALDAIAAHKMRSFLTILGILIGIASIIAIMSIGQGATELIIKEIDQMGARTVMVLPSTDGGVDMMDMFFADLLTETDLNALKRSANVPYLEEIMPVVTVPGSVRHRNEIYRSVMTLGASAEFFGDTFNVRPGTGTNFTGQDITGHARVAVIGSQVKEELFDHDNVVGESITINNHRFRIVGVYPKTGQRGPFNVDDLVIVPYTSAQTYIMGTNEFDRFIIRAQDADKVDQVGFDITATLRETRNIEPGDDDNFTVMTQQDLRDTIGNVMGILTNLLVAVVSIALLVGGIGIMNIMLVSVTERTREIGLRKAVGATRQDILKQFIWEALTLTMIGGIIGIILGSSASWGASMILSQVWAFEWPFVFPIEGAVLGVVMSALAGVIFGLYPAREASRKDPIEALQYEK